MIPLSSATALIPLNFPRGIRTLACILVGSICSLPSPVRGGVCPPLKGIYLPFLCFSLLDKQLVNSYLPKKEEPMQPARIIQQLQAAGSTSFCAKPPEMRGKGGAGDLPLPGYKGNAVWGTV